MELGDTTCASSPASVAAGPSPGLAGAGSQSQASILSTRDPLEVAGGETQCGGAPVSLEEELGELERRFFKGEEDMPNCCGCCKVVVLPFGI